MKQHLLLGTAGHIDHGKTALVRALTGVDTDRLPDEKRRQITIDLGFAPLEVGDFSIGIVDVPGHERFVKNMLAGAAGVDLAMLVVAADDSVKPQTREHLDILNYLRLDTGIIVISKCDLADPEWIELVESEVRELTAETFLAAAPIVRVSARTGDGLDDLRGAIAAAAEHVVQHRESDPGGHFRLAVDRVFTIAGHGTVVTGSVASGQTRVGDELELQPLGRTVRVRGLQSHTATVEQVGRGQRAAVNLAGVHYNEISRGQSLASCHALRPSQLLTVELELSDQLARAVKHRSAIRLHLGTASIAGKLALLGDSEAEPGATLYAQLFLSRPVAAVWGQPFVIRSLSPVETLGGGRVLDPLAVRIKQTAVRIKQTNDALREALDDLTTDEPARRAAAAAYLAGSRDWQPTDWSVLAGVHRPAIVLEQLMEQQLVLPFPLGNGETQYLHRDIAAQLFQRINHMLAAEHRQSPLRKLVERSRLARHFSQPAAKLLDAIYLAMQAQGQLVVEKRGIAMVSWAPQLSTAQQEVLKQLQTLYQAAQWQPPPLDQLAATLGHPVEVVAELVEVAVEAGELVRLSKELLLSRDAEQQARTVLTANMAEATALSVSQIRDLLGTSRKIAVPLCEYLDAIGMTRREGNLRRLVISSGTVVE